jgi:heptosyltransferase-1
VGVDTGLVHLAAAIGTPTVSIFGATDPLLCGVGPAGSWARDLGGIGAAPTADDVLSAAAELMRLAPRC